MYKYMIWKKQSCPENDYVVFSKISEFPDSNRDKQNMVEFLISSIHGEGHDLVPSCLKIRLSLSKELTHCIALRREERKVIYVIGCWGDLELKQADDLEKVRRRIQMDVIIYGRRDLRWLHWREKEEHRVVTSIRSVAVYGHDWKIATGGCGRRVITHCIFCVRLFIREE